MGNWIVDLTNYLRSSNDSKWSEAAFAYQLPEGASDPSIVIVPPIDGLRYDRYLPDWYRGMFQAIVTSRSIPQANETAQEVLRTLTLYDRQLGDTNVIRSTPENIPITYPVSDSDLFETSVSFDIAFIDTRIRTGS